MKDADLIRQALEDFGRAEANESQNRSDFRKDIKFARLSEQWPPEVIKQRQDEGRPALTINKLAPVIRQIVNDARLNRPSISVRPVDNKADADTAEVMTGLIRNIEHSSDADIACDTAIDNAVSGGFGYFAIDLDYANDVDPSGDLSQMGSEVFEKDICFRRIVNSLSVYGDPDSTSATSDDWNVAFEIEDMPRATFKRKFPKAGTEGFHSADAKTTEWVNDKTVRVAKYWRREKAERRIVAVNYPQTEDTMVLLLEDFEKRKAEIEASGGTQVGAVRSIPSYKVTCYLLTAIEVLETINWLGTFIPIVPVYGDEVYSEGKRYLRSVIRDAKDANQMFNYWRTASTELVALAPKVPWLIEEDALIDEHKWATANNVSHPYLEYKQGTPMPQRTIPAQIPAGALQEALNAADDIKAVTGMYDASLGARSNETSGKAIAARQREGDVSSFHFIDNLTRSIRHAGRIIIDLIPKVYSAPRIVRVLGEDGEAKPVKVNGPPEPAADMSSQRIYDLRVGRYDLAVTAGPSFTTRREEAATQMIELIRSYPDAAPIIGDLLAKNLDWPGADEIAKRLEKMLPPQVRDDEGGIPPEVQAQMQQMAAQIQELMGRLQQAESDNSIDHGKLEVEQYKAETDRLQLTQQAMGPEQIQAIVMQTLADVLGGQELPQVEGLAGPTAQPEPDGIAA